MKRSKALLALLLLVFSITGCAGKNESAVSSQGNSDSLKIGYLPSPGHLLYFVAQEEGLFKEEGLNTELVMFGENNSELAALESGKIDVGAFGSSELVTYLGDGHEITVFGGAMIAGHGLIVKPELVEGIPEEDWSLDLLKGKNIGVEGVDSGYIVYRSAAKKLGLENSIEFSIFADGADAYNSLKNDDIDAAILYAPYRILAEDEGYVIFSNSGTVSGFEDHVCCRQATLTSSLEKDPDNYEAFLRALIRAYHFYKTEPDKTIKDVQKYVDVDEGSLRKDTYDYDSQIANPDPDITGMTNFYDALVDTGFVNEFDISHGLSAELYDKALNAVAAEDPDDEVYKYLLDYHKERDK
ncbi:MAG: myristoyl transferase [Ruminococcus albus]|nr:myristoyl transferase [Ruminococcus albus]